MATILRRISRPNLAKKIHVTPRGGHRPMPP